MVISMMMESPVGFTHHLTDVLAHGRHSMNICGIIASPTRGVFFFFPDIFIGFLEYVFE